MTAQLRLRLDEIDAHPHFTETELRAILLGASDGMRSIRPLRRRVRLAEWFFGFRPATELTNPRLEAIRSFVVQLRHARAPELQPLVEQALLAGVRHDQAYALYRRFSRTMPRTPYAAGAFAGAVCEAAGQSTVSAGRS